MRRRVGSLLVATILLIVSSASADEVSDWDHFQLWNGCMSVDLVIGELSKDAKEIGLLEEDIETAVRSRLRGARIYNENALSFLFVIVNVVGPASSISAEFHRKVRVLLPFLLELEKPEGIPFIGYTATWVLRLTGIHDRDSNFILSHVARSADKFIDEYLRVNADACE